MTLSPLACHYQHLAEIEAVVQGDGLALDEEGLTVDLDAVAGARGRNRGEAQRRVMRPSGRAMA